MKRNIFIALAATLVFGLAAAVYAFNTTTNTKTSAAVSCCCKGDSCPMKSKDGKAAASADAESCCGAKCDCCSGDSCQMKKGDAKMTGHKMGSDDKAAESCPMMKDGKMAADHSKMKHEGNADAHKNMDHSSMKDGEHSCSCACCAKHKEEKKVETAS